MTTLYVHGVEESCQGLRENAFRRTGLKSASSQQPGNGLLRDDPKVIKRHSCLQDHFRGEKKSESYAMIQDV